jgi:GntR family transcriptional regulator
MTARHALTTLEREGVVERRRHAGTFVAQPRIRFNKLTSYTEQMSSRGLTPHSKLITGKVVYNEHEIAAQLNLPSGNPLVKIERIRHAGDEPFALESCYLSDGKFPGLLAKHLATNSLFYVVENEFGVPLTCADEEVDATAAEERAAALLNVSSGSPILRIRQIIRSSNNQPIMYVLGLYRAQRHSLFIRRFR